MDSRSLHIALKLVFAHLPFFMLLLAFLIGFIRCGVARNKPPGYCVEGFIAYIFLLAVGVGGIWGFIVHTYFHAYTDAFIGWKWSPFEVEVAVANLALGLAGILSFSADRGFRMATALVALCFGWGAAAGHIYQMVELHNFEPGNAGLIFWTDIFVPLLLWVFLWADARHQK